MCSSVEKVCKIDQNQIAFYFIYFIYLQVPYRPRKGIVCKGGAIQSKNKVRTNWVNIKASKNNAEQNEQQQQKKMSKYKTSHMYVTWIGKFETHKRNSTACWTDQMKRSETDYAVYRY